MRQVHTPPAIIISKVRAKIRLQKYFCNYFIVNEFLYVYRVFPSGARWKLWKNATVLWKISTVLYFMRGWPTIRYRTHWRNLMRPQKLAYAEDTFLRLFIENAPIPLFAYSREGKVLFWNGALQALLGESALREQTFQAIARGCAPRRIQSIIRSVFQGRGITDISWETGLGGQRAFSMVYVSPERSPPARGVIHASLRIVI
jgi:PAS domain-containing protein